MYTVDSASDNVSLTVSKRGGIRKGTDDKDNLVGAASRDVLYGGKRNGAVYGKNGRDAAVYNKLSWERM
ncbi:MAG: hypothetical protein K5657_06070 [Desulfovibrio sp.]|nr:hypothetical protein [Desulfovibrio sp.]